MSSQLQTGMEERDDAARELDAETAAVEFKSAFNPADKGEFLEILKDIAAMAKFRGRDDRLRALKRRHSKRRRSHGRCISRSSQNHRCNLQILGLPVLRFSHQQDADR
jgi:hypothetical protein